MLGFSIWTMAVDHLCHFAARKQSRLEVETSQDRGANLQIMSVMVNSNLQRQSTLE